MNSKPVIKEISYASSLYETIKGFREELLRAPLGLPLSEEDTEGEDKQIHIAALENDEAVIGSVILKPLPEKRMKFRQMAVSARWQGRGLGRELVRFAENMAIMRKCRFMEITARKSAWGFYEKLGYHPEGEQYFELVTLPCIKMVKTLET